MKVIIQHSRDKYLTKMLFFLVWKQEVTQKSKVLLIFISWSFLLNILVFHVLLFLKKYLSLFWIMPWLKWQNDASETHEIILYTVNDHIYYYIYIPTLKKKRIYIYIFCINKKKIKKKGFLSMGIYASIFLAYRKIPHNLKVWSLRKLQFSQFNYASTFLIYHRSNLTLASLEKRNVTLVANVV